MDLNTLLLATALILTVFSIAYLGAFHDLKDERFWRTWALAQLGLAGTLMLKFQVADDPTMWDHAPVVLGALFSLSLFRQGALEFNGNPTSLQWFAWPVGALALAAIAATLFQAPLIFTCSYNLVLAAIALSTAREYASERTGPLSSRAGLVFSHLVLATDLAMLFVQHIVTGHVITRNLPLTIPYSMHVVLWMVFALSNGAFSLAIAFERKLREEREAAVRDPLTGAYNRREMMRRLECLLDTPSRRPFAFVLLDLDHFKSINDRFGHDAGDEVLQSCVDLINWNIRPEDCLARLGGEEFAILMTDVPAAHAQSIAERIRANLAAAPVDLSGESVTVTLSAGVYYGLGLGLTPKQILRAADQELYRSKNLGRNRVSTTYAA